METTNVTQTKSPRWFMVLAIIFLLWNLMGVFSFFGNTFISEEVLAKMPENERALYDDFPIWTFILFAIATFGGLLASIGLILKRKWARTFFIISFLAIIPQMTQKVFFTKSIDVYGLVQSITMPILVVLIGALSIWFTNYCINKNWLK